MFACRGIGLARCEVIPGTGAASRRSTLVDRWTTELGAINSRADLRHDGQRGRVRISSDNPLVHPRRVTWKVSALSLAVCLVTVIVVLWTFHLDLARFTATRLLNRAGLGPVELTVSSLNLFKSRASGISLFGGGIRVPDLVLAYDPRRLAAGIVDRVEIARPQVKIGVTGNDITIGGTPLRFAASPDGASPFGGIRIDAIRISEAHVTFDSPTGPLEATFSTNLALSGTDMRNTSLALDLTVPMAGGVRTVRVAAPKFALSARDGGGLRLSFDKVTILPKDIPWAMDDLGGEVLWRANGLSARIASGHVSNTQNPAFVTPLNVTGEATMAGSRIKFAAHAVTESIGGKGKISLDAAGSHDRSSGIGNAIITAAPVTFQPKGVQPHDFFPAIGDTVPVLSGTAALSGAITWRDAVLAPALILRLVDVAYEPKGARLSKVHGDIRFVGLWPVATPRGQELTGTIEAGGLPPTNAMLMFQLLPKPALSVEAIRMDFAGGRIVTSPFTIDPKRPDVETTIAFQRIDLTEFFKLVGVDGLGGSGHLDGQIPLRIARGNTVIRDGKLTAAEPGVLRLRRDVLPKQITDAGESMTLVLQVLEDFHYDTLVIDLAGNPTGDASVVLRLKGNNPAVLDGRAFNLNISLQSNFDRLVDLALRSMAAARELLRRTTGNTRQ